MTLIPSNDPKAKPNIDQVASPDLVIQRSQALKMLCQGLRGDKTYAILDLGSAVKENIDFYSSFARKIQIEDLYDSLSLPTSSSSEEEGGDGVNKSFEHMLPYTEDTRFDFIFTWDLFNYLTRDQLQKLVAHLGKFCNRRAILFSLITNDQHVPEHPIDFRILDQENLSYLAGAIASRVNARYKEPNLAKFMPGFNIYKTFLLRNGMQEYLFTLSED